MPTEMAKLIDEYLESSRAAGVIPAGPSYYQLFDQYMDLVKLIDRIDRTLTGIAIPGKEEFLNALYSEAETRRKAFEHRRWSKKVSRKSSLKRAKTKARR